jgi:hypothetical protein
VIGDPDRAIQVIKEGLQFCERLLQKQARPPGSEPYDAGIERYQKLLDFFASRPCAQQAPTNKGA